MTDLDDRTLLERWRDNRDGDAFAEIARRHSPVVFDLTARVLGDRSGAEDILQEALLGLALETTAKPADVGVIAWLARFAICRARNKRSSERCRTRRQIVVGSERPEDVMPEESLEHSDELEHALRGCDPEDRALLAMRFLHDWDYDRIASALSISEGAARVRVHRALNAVRANTDAAGARTTKTASVREIAGRLAVVPVAPLAASRLDAAISSTIELAKVRLGAAPNGVEQRTAATRGFQTAVRLAGAAFALVIGVGLAGGSDERTSSGERDVARGGASGDLVAIRDAGDARSVRRDAAEDSSASTSRRGPGARPWDWDGGALDRLADVGRERGAAGLVAAPRASAAPSKPSKPSSRMNDAAPAAAKADGDLVADRLDALGAADAAGDGTSSGEDSQDAFRPMSRGTRAAKGETVSSDGERAGASGVSSTGHGPGADSASGDGETAGDRDAADTATRSAPRAQSGGGGRQTRSPAATPAVEFVPLAELPADQRALVDEAGDLLRLVLAARGDDLAAEGGAAAALDAKRLRAVRSTYSKLRRAAVRATGSDAPRGDRAGAAGVAVGRLVSLLTRVEFGGGGDAGSILFPRGGDVSSTLSEVIRVLGAATENLSAAGPAVQDASAASAE